MKQTLFALIGAMAMAGCCCPSEQNTQCQTSTSDAVINTIMSRRSVRQYLPQAVGRDTMQIILDCGINAPNGMNAQPWQVRVVDNQADIAAITAEFAKANPRMAEDASFKNMFRNAPTVVFIATEHAGAQIDCGLLGENMILAAWSMGIGSCCLGGPVHYLKTAEEAKPFLEKLDLPEGFEIVYCIGFGYPDEQPEAKPRDASKVKFID